MGGIVLTRAFCQNQHLCSFFTNPLIPKTHHITIYSPFKRVLSNPTTMKHFVASYILLAYSVTTNGFAIAPGNVRSSSTTAIKMVGMAFDPSDDSVANAYLVLPSLWSGTAADRLSSIQKTSPQKQPVETEEKNDAMFFALPDVDSSSALIMDMFYSTGHKVEESWQ